MKNLYLMLLLLTFVMSCEHGKSMLKLSNNKTSNSRKVEEKQNYKLYEVLKTDTIASIARKHKVPSVEIIKFNNVPKPYYIEPGTIIKIPLPENSESLSLEIKELLKDKNTTVLIAPSNFQEMKTTESNIRETEPKDSVKNEETAKSLETKEEKDDQTSLPEKNEIASQAEINSQPADNLPKDLNSSDSLDQDV